MSVTVEDVENYAAKQWQQLDPDVKQEQLELAESMLANQFSERMATLPNFKGDRDFGLKLLTAHLWELAQGGEAQSESSEGGSVTYNTVMTYNTVTGNAVDSLQETKYGRLFRDQFLFDEQGVGVVRSR